VIVSPLAESHTGVLPGTPQTMSMEGAISGKTFSLERVFSSIPMPAQEAHRGFEAWAMNSSRLVSRVGVPLRSVFAIDPVSRRC
jgi:hypothetical protein